MTTPQSTAHSTLRAQAGRAIQMSESAPRSSRVRFSVVVTGTGETRLAGRQRIEFGTLMLEEPTFTFGVIANGEIPLGAMPQATAVVLSYARGRNNLYTAAEVGFRVVSSRSNISLKFSLTFEGTALRSTAGIDSALGVTSASNVYRGPLT